MSRIIKKLRALIGLGAPVSNSPVRLRLARRYLKGRGIEVGALHAPLPVPKGAHVTYVDRMSVEQLRQQYPELAELPLVDVDVVDDGEGLSTFAEESQDFVIANHFLEHTQDPIGTLKRHVAVLKKGGVIYMALPDKRLTFDAKRPDTTMDHLLKDHEQGPEWSYEQHLREYAELVDAVKGQALEERVALLRATNYSIHFHVWSESSFRTFLEYMINDLKLPVAILEQTANPKRAENIAVMRRLG